ncbi:MAG: phosphotransferase [Bacteroidetes bacterium]|nr:phosphotransferase [Bacteroidota bacterium]MBT6685714.1 phosphotransferase [Bacteroidota bacterium]MBT7143509.1 phosphotransferase [Bacteroidota bacterium]MBT7492234.1 phosphotransferase [Bacteroidota bacterium]
MDEIIKNNLTILFEDWADEKVSTFSALPVSGSSRKYFRIVGENNQAIGAFNNNFEENDAFIDFSQHFFNKKLQVPEIYSVDLSKNIYLLQDLGNETLFSVLNKKNNWEKHSTELIDVYKNVVEELLKFQTIGNDGLDYSKCYPRQKFDEQSIMWDLNYFKYYFLKLADIKFNEQKLEDNFLRFAKHLIQANSNFFMFRDFQSRNIMISNNEIYFIDYQGGRKGALQYDLASLLFQAKAEIPFQIRDEILRHYLKIAKQNAQIDTEEFMKYYYSFVLIRTLQVLGAYGFRGFYERKSHFIESIPFAIKNLKWITENQPLPIELRELFYTFKQIISSEKFKTENTDKNILTVNICSFSYKKKGIPIDMSGNGGGFVFDCRANNNPGRYKEYQNFTGKDKAVIDFFKDDLKIKNFLTNIYNIVDDAVENYIERKFSNLAVNFGCTGGQHRSVYSAEMLAKHLQKYGCKIILKHQEFENI